MRSRNRGSCGSTISIRRVDNFAVTLAGLTLTGRSLRRIRQIWVGRYLPATCICSSTTASSRAITQAAIADGAAQSSPRVTSRPRTVSSETTTRPATDAVGGAIFARGDVTLTDSIVANNHTTGLSCRRGRNTLERQGHPCSAARSAAIGPRVTMRRAAEFKSVQDIIITDEYGERQLDVWRRIVRRRNVHVSRSRHFAEYYQWEQHQRETTRPVVGFVSAARFQLHRARSLAIGPSCRVYGGGLYQNELLERFSGDDHRHNHRRQFGGQLESLI